MGCGADPTGQQADGQQPPWAPQSGSPRAARPSPRAGRWRLRDQGPGFTCPSLSPVGTVDVGKARLMFWDLGGQEELQSLWDKVRESPHVVPGHALPFFFR